MFDENPASSSASMSADNPASSALVAGSAAAVVTSAVAEVASNSDGVAVSENQTAGEAGSSRSSRGRMKMPSKVRLYFFKANFRLYVENTFAHYIVVIIRGKRILEKF